MRFQSSARRKLAAPMLLVVVAALYLPYFAYSSCRIDVPAKHIAVLIRKTGTDILNDMEVAPSPDHKGVQREVLTEGRYFKNPYTWDWEIVPMVEVPTGKLGVVVRLEGDNLPYGEIIAHAEGQKGIVEDVLRPGRYPINPYLERVELHAPVTVPAGFKGVVTLLAAPMPDDPNVLLVEEGRRGVQEVALDPGTYYINPYVMRVNLVDCRSQRFNLAENEDMGFPSKDGFWVRLDGTVEFRVRPEQAASVFVTYNDMSGNGRLDEAIISKIIMPNARSFCRLRGSSKSGREFIGGDTRSAFQKDFQVAMKNACEPLGIEIIQALIAQIYPPDAIAGPVRNREVARQKLSQYTQQIEQQESEMHLAVEQALVLRSQALVKADQEVVTMTVEAMREQEVAVTKANENLEVARLRLEAARDEAAALVARGKADADVIRFQNEAEAAGWREAVTAFGGDGDAYARYVLYQTLAPGFARIMANTKDSPLMQIFETFGAEPASTAAPASRAARERLSIEPTRPTPPREATGAGDDANEEDGR